MFYYYFEINSYFLFFVYSKKCLIHCIYKYVTGSSTQVQYQIGRINVQSYL